MTVIGWVAGGGILLFAGTTPWISIAGLAASVIVLFLVVAGRAYGAAWPVRWPLLRLAALSCSTVIAFLGMATGVMVAIGENLCFEGGCSYDWTGTLISGCSLVVFTIIVIALRRSTVSIRMRRLGVGS